MSQLLHIHLQQCDQLLTYVRVIKNIRRYEIIRVKLNKIAAIKTKMLFFKEHLTYTTA